MFIPDGWANVADGGVHPLRRSTQPSGCLQLEHQHPLRLPSNPIVPESVAEGGVNTRCRRFLRSIERLQREVDDCGVVETPLEKGFSLVLLANGEGCQRLQRRIHPFESTADTESLYANGSFWVSKIDLFYDKHLSIYLSINGCEK